jgi:excisionase family DNA binding protein
MSNESRSKRAPRPFYSPRTLAEIWDCSDKKIRREIKRGKLFAHKFGGQVRISHADRMAYERANRLSDCGSES